MSECFVDTRESTRSGGKRLVVIGELLVTGCPRSGTKYAATLLTALGRDVGHESMGRNGISSWCMAVSANAVPWGPARKEHETFNVALHQVRNPRLVIPSLSTLRDDSWEFICMHTPCDPEEPLLLRAAKLWYHWNLEAERIAQWRYRLEELTDLFPEFCYRTHAPCDRRILERVGANINSRAYDRVTDLLRRAYGRMGHELPEFIRRRFVNREVYQNGRPFQWGQLRRLDRRLHENVRSLAQSYGYTPSDLGSE